MNKKEVYLQFGSKRNKCITFESKLGISDWDNLREVMRQTAEKDEDLKRRLQNCNNIIFQKYKVKKSTGERILVDVDEDEEHDIENDADLSVVFCCLDDITKSQTSENTVQNTFSKSSSSLFIDLSSDMLKYDEILNETESNDINIKFDDNDEIIGTYEIDENSKENIDLQMIDTVTMKQNVDQQKGDKTENSLKRKINIKSKSEKNIKKLKALPFHVPNMLPHTLCEYTKHPNGIIKHSSEFIRYYAGMLRTQLNDQIGREHYKEMAKIIADRHPILADEGEDVSYGSIKKSLSECVRNLRAREKKKVKQFAKEALPLPNFSCNKEENVSSMALIHPVDTESYLQETEKEKKKQEEMMEELKTLTEKVGLTSHVKALMRETFTKRKEIINTSDTINTVVSNFPFLLNAEMILFELSLRVNLKLSDIFERIDALIVDLGSFLKVPDDTFSENRKLNILQKIYSSYKPKRAAKSVQQLFTVKDASSPPGEELITKETEGPRLVTYVENNTIVAAFVVADKRRVKINKLSTTECVMVLLGAYHAWASDFPGPYVSSLSIFDYFALDSSNNYSCKMFDDFKRDFRRWRLSMRQNDKNAQSTHN